MTEQINAWTGSFGVGFTNRWDVTLEEADARSTTQIGRPISACMKDMVQGLPIRRVLEVGCNVGQKLAFLSQAGDYQLFGVDPQKEALRIARARYLDMNFVEGDAFDLPFADGFFDLSFTSVLLIHIKPADLPRAMKELHRVSKKFVMGMEFHSDKLEEVEYRGRKDLLWKQDFEARYKELFPALKTVRSATYEYAESYAGKRGLFDKHFILTK